MMTERFVIYNPVKLHFGKQVVDKIDGSMHKLNDEDYQFLIREMI